MRKNSVGTHEQVPIAGAHQDPCLDHYVEKHNQNHARQHMKRCPFTATHSKKLENHVHMVALYTTWYNFARISSIRMSPAMASRITDRLWDIGDIVKLIEDWGG